MLVLLIRRPWIMSIEQCGTFALVAPYKRTLIVLCLDHFNVFHAVVHILRPNPCTLDFVLV